MSYELNTGENKFSYLSFPLKMIRMFTKYKISPIAVFDGRFLDVKKDLLDKRQKDKKENQEMGLSQLEAGKEDEARKHFKRSLKINSKMIDFLVDLLKDLGVRVIVAPYEADAQVSYLVKKGVADFGVSEDSDLLVFGCPRLVVKLNPSGRGKEIVLERLFR